MDAWVVFVHVAAVLAFMLSHGVHMTAMWAMRREPDPERMLTFFNDMPTTTGLRVILAVVVLSGAIAGFLGSWWSSGWIWVSLGLLAFIAVMMWRFGGAFFSLVEEAAGTAVAARITDPSDSGPQAAYDLARRSWHTPFLSVIGLGGLAMILWLMMFKPF